MKKTSRKTSSRDRVLVAMSGGVDSSVAAALLLEQGYDVTGAFMVQAPSCWVGDYQDALRVAAKLGIRLLKLDFTKEYKKTVLDYMFKEYKAGRTPNPDVLCNKFVKFGVWLKKAKKLGFDKLATGHYARLWRETLNPKLEIRNKFKTQNSKKLRVASYELLVAKDVNKDQTYFLHQLNQKQLENVLFPLGNYLKSEVRSLARHFNLPVADKEESMGICFVGEVPMKEFLQTKIKTKTGDVVMSSVGANCCSPIVIGQHDGLAFYTIGQRVGHPERSEGSLFHASAPLYVVDKNIKKNQLIIGYENDLLLYKKEVVVKNANWISQKPKFPLKCMVRLRHRQQLQKCIINNVGTGLDLSVQFNKPQRAVTPGQFAVFYLPRGKVLCGKIECLGGGVIE